MSSNFERFQEIQKQTFAVYVMRMQDPQIGKVIFALYLYEIFNLIKFSLNFQTPRCYVQKVQLGTFEMLLQIRVCNYFYNHILFQW